MSYWPISTRRWAEHRMRRARRAPAGAARDVALHEARQARKVWKRAAGHKARRWLSHQH